MIRDPYPSPGVYREDVFPTPETRLPTGVPAFLGIARSADGQPQHAPRRVTLWSQFAGYYDVPPAGYLAHAVRGFFENGGRTCYVLPLADLDAGELERGLATLEQLDDADLVCAPDIVRPRGQAVDQYLSQVREMQKLVLDHCSRCPDRFAILDSVYSADEQRLLEQRQALNGDNGALYYPWIGLQDGPATTRGQVPPSGHIAGLYARTDASAGVHKPPANGILVGAIDVEVQISTGRQNRLNPQGINCVRAFPGRGIRVWGARTLSQDPNWTYVNVRRVFLTARRWIELNLTDAAFEPNDPTLWARIARELGAYCESLYTSGALRGSTREEAYYVRCDAGTNSGEARGRGAVVAEVGLAPAVANEFVVVRIVHGASGIRFAESILTG